MALRGCIRIDSLPLQILLNDNPSWHGTPVAVTREVKPRSPILALNRAARDKGLATGMRYANALALVPGLKAREVAPDRISAARELIVRTVHGFTPDVEPCPFDVDAVWVSLEGLTALFGDERQWIASVRRALSVQGFSAHVVAGFTRFGTYALVRGRRSLVFGCREDELAQMGRASVEVLPLARRVKDTLARLEVRTLRQFVSLPAGEIVRRFGREAGALHHAFVFDDPLPIQPAAVKELTSSRRHLDAPLTDLERLFPHIEELLELEARRVESERSVISELTLVLRTEEGDVLSEVIRPAVPTLRTPVLLRLARLRLSGRAFTSAIEDIEVCCTRAAPSRRQEDLFASRGRDLRAGARAFAAIRARFGNDSVLHARLDDSHLPERSFTWAPLDQPARPAVRDGAAARPHAAVRRILFEPRAVSGREPSRLIAGPFAVSGGWWEETPFQREYSYRESPTGITWQYVDALTGRAWIQGVVD